MLRHVHYWALWVGWWADNVSKMRYSCRRRYPVWVWLRLCFADLMTYLLHWNQRLACGSLVDRLAKVGRFHGVRFLFGSFSVEFTVKQVVWGDLDLLIVINLVLGAYLSETASFDILVINAVLGSSLLFFERRDFIDVLIVSFKSVSTSKVFVGACGRPRVTASSVLFDWVAAWVDGNEGFVMSFVFLPTNWQPVDRISVQFLSRTVICILFELIVTSLNCYRLQLARSWIHEDHLLWSAAALTDWTYRTNVLGRVPCRLVLILLYLLGSDDLGRCRLILLTLAATWSVRYSTFFVLSSAGQMLIYLHVSSIVRDHVLVKVAGLVNF